MGLVPSVARVFYVETLSRSVLIFHRPTVVLIRRFFFAELVELIAYNRSKDVSLCVSVC